MLGEREKALKKAGKKA